MSTAPPRLRRRTAVGLVAALGVSLAASLTGCQVIGFIAAGAEAYQKGKPRTVQAEYTGLAGKTFAVVVSADRMIQSDFPGVTDELTARITEHLEKESGASGRVRTERLLRYLYDHPSWVAMPRGELAKRLGVDRLVYVELLEYQLNDPGNQYLWKGVAAGTVGVIEADSSTPDEYAFQKPLRITFPDKEGFGPGDMNASGVASVLIKRFTDRAAWLFFTHQEPGDLDY
jgi:hypothetical protein